MYKMSKILAMLVVVGFVVAAQAGRAEYSDAVGYGSAHHTTGEWQRLGTAWDTEDGPKDVDTSDDGVFWSTDGGNTWGHDIVTPGEAVTFRFDMTRAGYGRHSYDQLKVWVDWNQDKVWDNDPAHGEVLLATQWFKGDTMVDDDYYKDYVAQHGVAPNPNAELTKSFYATAVVPQDMQGCTWLRARVHCNHTTFDNIGPYGELTQGEVEDYELCTTVPAPSAIALAGIGLAIVRRLRGRNWE